MKCKDTEMQASYGPVTLFMVYWCVVYLKNFFPKDNSCSISFFPCSNVHEHELNLIIKNDTQLPLTLTTMLAACNLYKHSKDDKHTTDKSYNCINISS